MDTTRKEIIDVRKQCDAVNQDASAFRAETSKVRMLNHLIYLLKDNLIISPTSIVLNHSEFFFKSDLNL